jgi:phosphoribosyl-AMP cyclohydrolase
MLTEQLDWEKTDGMMPAIVQHAVSGEVLMLGYMNKDALEKTEATGNHLYSRTKQRLWTKGETSGNVLNVVSITPDCDNDTLLVLVNPIGPTCHKAPPAASATPATSGCSCISWSSCWPSVSTPTRRAPTRRSCMPAAPSASRRSGRRRRGDRAGRHGERPLRAEE